jgi:hypothetical protein
MLCGGGYIHMDDGVLKTNEDAFGAAGAGVIAVIL